MKVHVPQGLFKMESRFTARGHCIIKRMPYAVTYLKKQRKTSSFNSNTFIRGISLLPISKASYKCKISQSQKSTNKFSKMTLYVFRKFLQQLRSILVKFHGSILLNSKLSKGFTSFLLQQVRNVIFGLMA